MAKKKVRVGVVGLGMGRVHAAGFHEDRRCDLVAVADQNADRLNTIGDELGIPSEQRYQEAEQMYAQAGLAAVSIAVPNKFHCPLTLAAIKNELHVLCEKPMAMNVAEARKMKTAADKAGKVLMINFSYRFMPTSMALKQQIDKGLIGNVYYGRTVWHRRRGMPGFGGWFGQKDLAGGGPLIDLGVHRIDLALWLMGHPTPVSVSGAAYNVIAAAEAKRQKKTFTTEDLACGLVKFDNGATLIVEASWALNINEDEHMITQLFGDKGGLTQKNVGGGYEFAAELCLEEKGSFYTKTLDRPAPTPSAYHEFVTCVLKGKKNPADADDGIRVQKILDGLYKSAETGREVVFK